ncbi:MAG TPA: galactose-1-epimerase, partial [Ruminococcaceae bacterium]|nr:galactose-1-epimerase [Oscillospiraceae bacterium]HCB90507.1 galactose-1-epimerase [Oscillospiraceae bacterium]
MSVEKREFGRLPDGTAVELYTLKNGRGMAAEVLSYGCRLARLFVPDRNG